jgi:3-phenylpropionate/trans-cinnamate dioxygenase ferredoxin subunit
VIATRVCSVGDVAVAAALRVVLDGVAVAVIRDEHGDLHAIGDLCTHADVSLSEGEVDDCAVECWLHGSRFDLRTGEPTSLPALRPVPVYPVTVDGDDVLVDIDRTIGAAAPIETALKES